jgi:TRAP-type mannitol/chloroaromatic compound transport system permease small subunit
MLVLKKISKFIDTINEKIGICVSWLATFMVCVVFYDTILRYAFQKGSIAMQELEWHLFSIVFLIGAAYTLKHDGHVRVDIIYTRLGSKAKAWINLIGTFFFLIPFSLLIIFSTEMFVMNSWGIKEISPNPGGLPARYIIKAMIPLGFFFLMLQGISQAIKNFFVIIDKYQGEQ